MPARALLLTVSLLVLLLAARALGIGATTASGDARDALQGGARPAGTLQPVGALQLVSSIAPPGSIGAASPIAEAAPVVALTAELGLPPDHLPGTQSMTVPDRAGPFPCFGGCGPSCACAGRRDSTQSLQHGAQTCTYQVIQCNTHPFCVWHDQCYLDCDNSMPNAVRRSGCYRQCDSSCLSGSAPFSNYPDPPGSYSLSDCIRWARHTQSAPTTGTMTFSQLQGCR